MVDFGLFEMIVSALFVVVGWVAKILYTAMRDLQTADRELARKVSEIEVLVAGHYITRNELDMLVRRLFDKLDRLENKIDGKVDK